MSHKPKLLKDILNNTKKIKFGSMFNIYTLNKLHTYENYMNKIIFL